jgi:hypothetical protein
MCKKKQFKYCPSEIDECMVKFIETLNFILEPIFYTPVACCCGHSKYPMTVILKDNKGFCFDLISGKTIPRKKKFYKKDDEGYYYIPEVVKR